jgi:hypothetical protein
MAEGKTQRRLCDEYGKTAMIAGEAARIGDKIAAMIDTIASRKVIS